MNLLPLAFMLGIAMLGAAADLRAVDTVEGSLLLVAKGEVEVYHNGRKAVLRDKADNDLHYRAKVPQRTLKAGDVVVLRVLSPYVYRVISAAISLPKEMRQIPIKKEHWRFLGANMDARKITAADIQNSSVMLASGSPDIYGETEREKLGFVLTPQIGSDWVKTADKLNGWYCIGFVLTPEMLKATIPVK